MALNLNKGSKLGKYFYIDNNVEYGPVEIDDLLKYINKDTLVYYKGIKWTKASEIPEIKKFFIVEERIVHTKVKEEVKNTGKNYFTQILFISILLIAIYLFYSYQKQQESEIKKIEFKKKIADSLEAVTEKLLAQTKQDSINQALKSQLDSMKLIEKKVIFLQNKDALLRKIKFYYLDVVSKEFDAFNYFSDSVNQYINLVNTSPGEINMILLNKEDYINEVIVVDDSSFVFSRFSDNVFYFNFSINYKCYRTNRRQNQSCDVNIEVGFDENQKIKSYQELEIKNLKFEDILIN